MKKTFMKIATLAIMAIGLTGCGQKLTSEKLLANNDSLLKDNSKTKVYYKDLNSEFAIEANKKLVDDLNKEDIIPSQWYTVINPSEATSYLKARFKDEKNVTNKKVTGGKWVLSEDGMFITYEKNYSSNLEYISEVENMYTFLKDKLAKEDLRNRYQTSKFLVTRSSFKQNKFSFISKYSNLISLVEDSIKKQIKLGGWQMVDSPEKADKEIYFELSRDYLMKEINELNSSKKGIRFNTLNNSGEINASTNSNSNHIVVGQSAMNAASNSNTNLASAGIGIGVSALFSLFGRDTTEESSGSFVSLKIIDKQNKTEDIKIYDIFVVYFDTNTRYDLMKKINETININPSSKEYSIKK